MYIGLLNLSILLVFGVAGLTATIDNRADRAPQVEYRAYTTPAGLDDKAAADRVWEFLHLPLSQPLPKYAIRRDASHDLTLDFYSPSGVRRAVVLEKENRIRLETRRNGFAEYLKALHTTTINRNPDWRMRWWGYYTEFSIWSLIAMSLSGVYLWLASRPFYTPARYAFALGCGAFLLLYTLTR